MSTRPDMNNTNNKTSNPRQRSRTNSVKHLFTSPRAHLLRKDDEYVKQVTEKAKQIAMAFAERDLQADESLVTLSEDISSLEKRNTMIYNQLITMSNQQVDDSKTARSKIMETTNILSTIREEYVMIDKLCESISRYLMLCTGSPRTP